MAATIEVAPPTPPASAPGRPSATPASAGVINVIPPAVIPTKAEEVPPNSAKAKMFEELGKKAKPTNSPAEERPGSSKPADKVADSKPADTPPPPDGKTATVADLESKPGEDGKKGKVSPWKLVEEYKAKNAALERDLATAKGSAVPEADRKSYDERIQKAEARAKEVEDHLRFVDYSKTEEFKTKYIAPYEKAWSSAMSELKEITLTDPGTQTERAVTSNDLLELVNLPLGKARQIANEVFGDFADDVMAHRKEIRNLYDAQNTALEDAKKNGAEVMKKAHEEAQQKSSDILSFVNEAWTKENEAVLKDEKYGQYFSPREGDEVWNQRLAKGYDLVDRAFAENPRDPSLTPDQRKAVVRRHAAIRNRAASWGAVRAENDVLKAKIAAIEKELGDYKGSEPGTGGGNHGGNGAPAAAGSAKDQMFAELQKRAKR